MFLPYTNTKNETRLHALFCIININNKYAFARVLPFTATRGGRDTDYNPTEPLDENGERGVNINGQRYEVKVKGQAYSQAKVITALSAILDIDVPKETEWLETKIPRDKNGKITDPKHLKIGGDLDKPYGTFAFKTIYTDEGQEFGKQFDLFCESRHIHHTRFGPTTGKKTRLGIVERFNRTLRELYYEHIKTVPRTNLSHYFTSVIPEVLKTYNRTRNHKSIEAFEKWKRGMKSSESFPKGLAFTPKYMMRGLNNMKWIDWKKEQTAKVANIYKDEEAFLNSNPKPKASYYKGIITIKKGKNGTPYQMKDSFGKGTEGTYSKPYQILRKNVNKNHWTNKIQDSHSFLLQSDKAPPGEGTLRLMAYDLDAGHNHPKHQPRRGRSTQPKKTKSKIRFLLV